MLTCQNATLLEIMCHGSFIMNPVQFCLGFIFCSFSVTKAAFLADYLYTLSGLQTRVRNQKLFSYFATKTYVVGTQKNRLNETFLLSIQNKCLN